MSLRRSALRALFATIFGAPLASAASVPAVVVGGSSGAPYPTGSVTLELAPHHGTQPVWTVEGDLARDLEAQAKAQNRIFYPPQLAGDPIELRFGVPQGVALSFGGQPLPVVNGIAVLRRSQSELLLGLEPKDLLIRGRTYATQVRLPFTVQRGESRVPLEVLLTAARYTPSLAPLIDSVAAGTPISHDGARSGGFFEYQGSVGNHPAASKPSLRPQ